MLRGKACLQLPGLPRGFPCFRCQCPPKRRVLQRWRHGPVRGHLDSITSRLTVVVSYELMRELVAASRAETIEGNRRGFGMETPSNVNSLKRTSGLNR